MHGLIYLHAVCQVTAYWRTVHLHTRSDHLPVFYSAFCHSCPTKANTTTASIHTWDKQLQWCYSSWYCFCNKAETTPVLCFFTTDFFNCDTKHDRDNHIRQRVADNDIHMHQQSVNNKSDKPDNQKNYKQLLTCCKVFIIPYKYILSLISDNVNKNITYV